MVGVRAIIISDLTPYPTAMIEPYAKVLEQPMNSLSEKDWRRYAAIEAKKLGISGIDYVAKLLGCSRSTIYKGAKDLGILPGIMHDPKIRRKGGGRKNSETVHASLGEAFLDTLKDDITGDAIDKQTRWT